jgi:hypothetical protein
MGSVFCTIAVPVLLYAILLAAKNVRGKALPHHEEKETAADPSPSEPEPGPGAQDTLTCGQKKSEPSDPGKK